MPAEPTPPAPRHASSRSRSSGVTKRFGAVVVLRGIDLVLRQGEVLGLVGDNGAGKSTLVKILCGFHQQDGGDVLVGGERVRFHSVEDARAHGIETVYQDLALIPQLPVYLNLFLGHELTRLGPAPLPRQAQDAQASRVSTSTTSACACRASRPRPSSSPAASGRRSQSREPCGRRRRSCCSTSRSPPWARASRASSSTSSRISPRAVGCRSS